MRTTKVVAITQRLSHVLEYGEERESLDTQWHTFFEQVGNVTLLPISYKHDPATFISDFAVDGIVLSGGNDLFFSSKTPECTSSVLSSKRDSFETELVAIAEKRGIPVLGVCRGMQLMARHFGGKIIPICPSRVYPT